MLQCKVYKFRQEHFDWWRANTDLSMYSRVTSHRVDEINLCGEKNNMKRILLWPGKDNLGRVELDAVSKFMESSAIRRLDIELVELP